MALHQKLFFLLLVLLPTQLGFHFWPQWAYVLGRRVDYLSPTIYLTDIVIVFMFILWFVRIKPKIKNNIIPLFVFIVINIFFAKSQPIAIYKWLKVLEFVALGWYIIKTRPSVSRVTYYLSLGVLYSSILAILQFVFQRSLGLWVFGERTFTIDTPGIARAIVNGKEILRPYATFPHPNVLAGYLTVSLLVIIQYTNNQIIKSSNKILYWFSLIFGFIALVLTFSRSAWIGFLIAMGIAKKKIFFPLLLVLLIFLFRFNVNEESFIIRNDLNSVAIRMWQNKPIFGVGLGNFLVELPKYLVSRDVYFLQPVHNIYLLLLSETGLVGLTLFFWTIWNIIKRKHVIIRYALFTILLLGFVDHYPITLQQGQLILTILLVLQ